MINISCCAKLKFEAAHRLYPCNTKCQNWHGHSYKVLVHARKIDKHDGLCETGMVTDFSNLKAGVGKWIDENWDHALLYRKDDNISEKIVKIYPSGKSYKCDFNPTAENMCIFLLEHVCPEIYQDEDFEVFKIQIYETEDCFAEVSYDDYRV